MKSNKRDRCSSISLKILHKSPIPRSKSLSSISININSQKIPMKTAKSPQPSIEKQENHSKTKDFKDFVSMNPEIASERNNEDFSFENPGKPVMAIENLEKIEGLKEETCENPGKNKVLAKKTEKIIEKKAFVQGKAGNLKISPMVQKSIKGSCKEKIEEIMKNKENVKTLNKISFQKVQKCSECQKDLKNEEKSMVVTLSCMHKVHKNCIKKAKIMECHLCKF